MNFPDFEALLQTYPASKIEEYKRAYSLEASLLGKIASQHLVEQEEITKKLCEESKKLKRDFNLAQAANVDLEKKVAELAEALKNCQDAKKIAKDASLKSCRRDPGKLEERSREAVENS
jgi:hypothetical protein